MHAVAEPGKLHRHRDGTDPALNSSRAIIIAVPDANATVLTE
jgi:hypothetical protein